MTAIFARTALTAEGWRDDVLVTLASGTIASVVPGARPPANATLVDVLLPAPGNVHSHVFQRAMAGLTETRAGSDDFWSWRTLMYQFLETLDPDDVEAIAAGVQMEMLEAGYAAVGEFHYLHHGPDGTPYGNVAELSERIVAAAETSGIGLTLLPVLYMQGGLDGAPLEGGQKRFGCDETLFERLMDGARAAVSKLPDDARIGTAPHSVRAVPGQVLADLAGTAGPKHIHIAEQTGEVDAVVAHTGTQPLGYLMSLLELGPDWTLIHATHGRAEELAAAARSGATVGLCPITESNLGDGIFNAPALLAAGGLWSVGSDSNVRISLTGELATLDYSQRLSRRARNPLAPAGGSSGRALFDGACAGSARALDRRSGRIAPGRLADLVALDGNHVAIEGLAGDRILDCWIFAGDDSAVTQVWSAGRHVVENRRHLHRDTIEPRFRKVLSRLRGRL